MLSVKKKILWLSHESNLSGANIAMLEYIEGLNKFFNFHVILPHVGRMEIELTNRNIPFSIVHQHGWTNTYPIWHVSIWIKIFFRSIYAVWQTNQLINAERPSIICTNTLIPFVASLSAWIKKIPHVWWIHEFGKEDFGFKIGWGYEKISFRWVQFSSSFIIGNSQAITNKFQQLMPKVPVVTVYQPVSWRAPIQQINQKYARYLMFGQIIWSKGHREVLHAMIANKQQGKLTYTLHIKGPCVLQSYLDELNTLIIENDLQKFVEIEVGHFIKEEVIPFYEVLVVASWSEAFGRVIVEANKAGLRVLVRDSGGAPELINETNGLKFSNQVELESLLCCTKSFPNFPLRINYNEDYELKKIHELLNSICH